MLNSKGIGGIMTVEYDDGGLPVHLYIGVDIEGNGPTNDGEAYRFICWCFDGGDCTVNPWKAP